MCDGLWLGFLPDLYFDIVIIYGLLRGVLETTALVIARLPRRLLAGILTSRNLI